MANTLARIVAEVRTELDLTPSADFGVVPGRQVMASYSSHGPGGWVIVLDGSVRPVGWLKAFDTGTWATSACTRDEQWTFMPATRTLRPKLVALEGSGQRAAVSTPRALTGRTFEVGSVTLRLTAPLVPLTRWRLRGEEGTVARLGTQGRMILLDRVIFHWSRELDRPALVTLFVAYAILIERYARTLMPIVAGGG